MGFFRTCIEWQENLSRGFDRLLPEKYRIDGNVRFTEDFLLPALQESGKKVLDIGAGRSPSISKELRDEKKIFLLGLDISEKELQAAGAHAYDEYVIADLCDKNLCDKTFALLAHAPFDLAISRALLEHLPDPALALGNIAKQLKPGAKLLVFFPCRNAAFAFCNRLLPEAIKRRLLFFLFPRMKERQGFPAYYHHCTPAAFQKIAEDAGFRALKHTSYYASSYFSFFTPLHVLWRVGQLCVVFLGGERFAESVSFELERLIDKVV